MCCTSWKEWGVGCGWAAETHGNNCSLVCSSMFLSPTAPRLFLSHSVFCHDYRKYPGEINVDRCYVLQWWCYIYHVCMECYRHHSCIIIIGYYQLRCIIFHSYIRPSVCPSIHPSARPFVRSSVYSSIHPFICLSIFPSFIPMINLASVTLAPKYILHIRDLHDIMFWNVFCRVVFSRHLSLDLQLVYTKWHICLWHPLMVTKSY